MGQSPVLPRSFYAGPPDKVARHLLGKVLVRRYKAGSGGKTERNAVLFGPPGFAYVYFIYGMYFCLNFSCEPDGQPGGVLLRALEPLEGLDTMAHLRGLASAGDPRLLTSGPGRLCEALGIVRKTHNGVDVTRARSGLNVEDDGFRPKEIAVSARIGIRKAADRPLRFSIAGNRFVSR